MGLTIDQMNQISLVRYGMDLNVPQGQPHPAASNLSEPKSPAEEAQPPRAAQPELNRLMQAIASETYSEVTSAELAQRTGDLVRGDRKALQKLANKATSALDAIRNLTVRDIANAQNDKIEGLFNKAADLQFQLSNKLREIAVKSKYQAPEFDGYRQMLEDFSLKCDSRGSEILTLFMEVKTFSEAQAIGPGSNLTNATAADLLKGMAGSMHGNDKSLLFKTEVDSIEASLAEIAHTTTVNPSHLHHLLDKTNQLSANLKDPKVAQSMDPDIHAKLTARLDNLKGELSSRADRAVADSVNTLFRKAATVNEDGRLVADFLLRKGASFPALKGLFALLARIENHGLRNDDDITAFENCLKAPSLEDEIQAYQNLKDPDKPHITLPKNTNQPVRDLFLNQIGVSEPTFSMAKQVTSELRERHAAWTDGGLAKLSGEDVINAFRTNAKLSMVLEARVNGVNEDSLNPQLCDDNLVAKKQLGKGAANVVYKMTYRMEDGTTKDFVFKPDLGGRAGFESLLIANHAYASTQQAVKHNTATCDVAELLGLSKLTGKNYATIHDGQYGLLMELAPGTEAAKVSDATDLDISRMFSSRKIVGSLARELNDLRWLDLATGQGDRHAFNYLVDFGPDKKTPRVTAIDNDLSFTSYLVGVGKFNVNHDPQRLQLFKGFLKSAFNIKKSSTGRMKYDEFIAKMQADNFIVNTQNASKEVLCALRRTFGFQSLTMPKQMSRALHDKLVSLTDDQLKAFALKLQSNIDRQDAVDATIQRLKDLREIAQTYEKDGKIVDDEAWVTDKDVLKRELSLDFPAYVRNLVDQDALYASANFLKRDFHVAPSLRS